MQKKSYDDYIRSTMYYKSCVNKQAPQVTEYCGNETIKAYPQAF